MRSLPPLPFAVLCTALFCVSTASAAGARAIAEDYPVPAAAAVWTSARAQHVYGFPGADHNRKGTLSLSADALVFTGKSGSSSIPRSAVTALSAGNQRVELFGKAGMLLRMAIPDGGGFAAAAVMHHRVDILTVEFNDRSGGSHAAVFFLPSNEADRALQNFPQSPVPPRQVQASDAVCRGAAIEPNSLLVSTPNSDRVLVPAAYRALVYEHLIDRLRSTEAFSRVYREGEAVGGRGCPQYTVQIAIAAFKEGSSVERAALGPAGFFVGTTRMSFDVTLTDLTDASGKLSTTEQIKATMRGESESTNVADHVAKSVARHCAAVLKSANKAQAGGSEQIVALKKSVF